MLKRWLVLVVVVLVQPVWAQMPHEVLLLFNRQSQASMKVANTYAAARQIPDCNLVGLDIPQGVYGGTATLTPEQFTRLIWEPANAAIHERGLENQILAWVYSVDFPIRVKTDARDRKQMSVLGLTFMRNQMPGLSLVEEGKYFSKLFAGPNDRLQKNLPSMSLRSYKEGLGDAIKLPESLEHLRGGLGESMPLPCMMLGYIGENGNGVETVLETIKRGVRSDYRGRRDGIYFVMSDDVRSTCREWQYYPAVNEMKQRGVEATVTTNFPAGKTNVMGILMGTEKVDPSQVGSFAPGAMAEHLTSWSAEFQRPQAKMTEWLKAGATGSAGSVVEPYSNPNKFPGARFFVHYVAGCTMLESFYQSIACPLQTLLLGDPLARPYAPPISVRLLGADTMKGDFTYVASAKSILADAEYRYAFVLDGKVIQPVSDQSSVFVRVNNLSDGYHELRALACVGSAPDFYGTVDRPIMVNRSGRSVEILARQIEKTGPRTHNLKVEVGGVQAPQKLRLVCGERVLDQTGYAEDAVLTLDEEKVGEGPARIQAVAVYADGMQVASPPLNITIVYTP